MKMHVIVNPEKLFSKYVIYVQIHSQICEDFVNESQKPLQI